MIESFSFPPQHVFLESDVYFATAVSVLHFEKNFSDGDALPSRWDAMDGSHARCRWMGRAEFSGA